MKACWLTAVLTSLLLSGTPLRGGTMDQNPIFSRLADVPASAWEHLAKKKICFGHQSVGANILEGIKDVMRKNPQIKLTLLENASGTLPSYGVFKHFRVGKNLDPQSKIDSFSQIMGQEDCQSADIAFFKFCYIDSTLNTDVDVLFKSYRTSMNRLAAAHPRTTFVHVTMPLTKRQTGLKALMKKMAGKPVSGYEDNIVRNRFNALLFKEYGGKAPVFDLARIEATYPDGKQELFEKNGSSYFALVPDYTNDDGHLNELGRQMAASELLRFLVSLN